MNKYNYRAKDKESKTIKGIVEARDEKQAARILQEKGLLVVGLSLKGESAIKEVGGIFFRRITDADRVGFTRQLSTMINAGLQLTNALSILEVQASPAMSRVVGEILREIEGGGSLGDALEKHSDVFDEVYVALVRAGEEAGILDKVLNRLADNLEQGREFKSRIKGAMIYPMIVVIGMFIVGGIMIIFVIPRLTAIYEEFQAELPFFTKLLLKISKFLVSFWVIGLVGLVGGIIGLKAAFKDPLVRKQYEAILFKIPIIGKLKKQIMLTEFTRTLGLLVGSGILVVNALSIVRRSLGSRIYEEAVTRASDDIEKGFPLATALARTEIFPLLIPHMISVGEETGKLDEALSKVSAYFEQEAAQAIRNLTSALEPLIMIVLGVGVAFLMVSVIMPIYNLTSQF